jgi:hypothetical protein
MTNKFRVVHHPQIPCEPFTVDVKDLATACTVSEALADQHLFLFENNFIPDYSNVIEVLEWDEEEQDWAECVEWLEIQEANA